MVSRNPAPPYPLKDLLHIVFLWLFLLVQIVPVNSETPHRVKYVYLIIEGDTKPGALRSFLNIKEGQVFAGIEDLEEALEAQKQELMERGYYTSVEYLLEGNQSDGYIVTFVVKEAVSFIPLPVTIYNPHPRRDDGYEGFYDNAFGSMTDWDLSLYAKLSGDGLGEWEIRQKVRKVKIGTKILSFDFSQSHEQIRFQEFGTVLGDYTVDETRASVSTSIEFENQVFYDISPGVVLRYNYHNYGGREEYAKIPLEFILNQVLGKDQYEWIGNARKGYRAKLSAGLGLGQTFDNLEWNYLTAISACGSYYYRPWKYISFYSNISAEYSFNTSRPQRGLHLRGISNNKMYGNKGLYLKNTMALDLLRWPDAVNFQLHPFFDMGSASSAGNSFHFLKMGAGLDIVLFLEFISNFAFRGSVGFDLGEYLDSETIDLEITIQTGLAY